MVSALAFLFAAQEKRNAWPAEHVCISHDHKNENATRIHGTYTPPGFGLGLNVYQAKPCEYLVADAHFNFKFTLRFYIYNLLNMQVKCSAMDYCRNKKQ